MFGFEPHYDRREALQGSRKHFVEDDPTSPLEPAPDFLPRGWETVSYPLLSVDPILASRAWLSSLITGYRAMAKAAEESPDLILSGDDLFPTLRDAERLACHPKKDCVWKNDPPALPKGELRSPDGFLAVADYLERIEHYISSCHRESKRRRAKGRSPEEVDPDVAEYLREMERRKEKPTQQGAADAANSSRTTIKDCDSWKHWEEHGKAPPAPRAAQSLELNNFPAKSGQGEENRNGATVTANMVALAERMVSCKTKSFRTTQEDIEILRQFRDMGCELIGDAELELARQIAEHHATPEASPLVEGARNPVSHPRV